MLNLKLIGTLLCSTLLYDEQEKKKKRPKPTGSVQTLPDPSAGRRRILLIYSSSLPMSPAGIMGGLIFNLDI